MNFMSPPLPNRHENLASLIDLLALPQVKTLYKYFVPYLGFWLVFLEPFIVLSEGVVFWHPHVELVFLHL